MRFVGLPSITALSIAVALSAGSVSRAASDGGSADAATRANGLDASGYFKQVQAVVQQHADEVNACYQRVLASDPCARGTLNLIFNVLPDGHFTDARANDDSNVPRAFADCVTRLVSAWRGPPSAGGVGRRIRYPFTIGSPAQSRPEWSCSAHVLAAAPYGHTQLEAVYPGPWWAVCNNGRTSELRPTTIKLEPFFDEMSGDKPGQKTGRRVRASGCAKPSFLVQGIAGLSARPLVAAKVTTRGKGPTRSTDISLGGMTYHLNLEERKGDGPWRLLLVGRGPPNAILAGDLETPDEWKVRWAGDLDGDDLPDFVLEEIDPDSGATILHLFLSRSAAVARDVREAAATYWGGC